MQAHRLAGRQHRLRRGGPGKGTPDPDVFKLWIDGVLQTPSDPSLSDGDVAIDVPKPPHH